MTMTSNTTRTETWSTDGKKYAHSYRTVTHKTRTIPCEVCPKHVKEKGQLKKLIKEILIETSNRISHLPQEGIPGLSRSKYRSLMYYAHLGASRFHQEYIHEFPNRKQPYTKIKEIEDIFHHYGYSRY
jgi:hypothetical protein